MKKLSGKFSKKEKTDTPTLIIPTTKTEETVPRKINQSDYEFLRLYAFKSQITVLQATDKLFQMIKNEVENKSTSIIKVQEDNEKKPEKSIRLSKEFNDYLKGLSFETNVPMKFIISFFVQYFKKDLEKEMGQ